MSKEIDGTEFACLTINAFMEEENKELNQKIADLEVKLAEKEKEIEKITKVVAYRDDKDLSTVINGVKFSNEQIITLQNIDYFADKHNQAKTDFAIEKLEKVKEFIFEQDIEITRLNKICDFLDQQIKELKGKK